MKKTFTLVTGMIFIILFVIQIQSIHAQHQLDVPGEYPTVTAALEAMKANAAIEVGSEVIINIAEGVYSEGETIQIGKAIKLTIQGAGPDKTTLKGFENRPEPIGDPGKRFIRLNNNSNNNLELTIKGIRFLNWGYSNATTDNGGVLIMAGGAILNVSVQNCEFDGAVSRGGAVIQANDQNGDRHTLSFDNCFFINCLTYDNDNLRGILNIANTANFSLTNSTFMSNEQQVLNIGADNPGNDRGLRDGIAITFHQGPLTPNTVVKNNVFVNNKITDGGDLDSEKAVIVVRQNIENPNEWNLVFENNVFIGNGREGDNKDVDLLYHDIVADKIKFDNPSGNILNTFKKEQAEATVVDVELEGFLVDPTYTYTDPRIGFDMEGDLPKVHVDDQGVGYLVLSGDGTDDTSVSLERTFDNLVIYSHNKTVYVKGLTPGEQVEVFSITGSLVAREMSYSDQLAISLPRGFFIIRSLSGIGKVVVQ